MQVFLRDQVGLEYYQRGLTFRTDELFDIIVDYPDSMAALEDLKVSSNSIALTDIRNASSRSISGMF